MQLTRFSSHFITQATSMHALALSPEHINLH
jgi:hypothetical protein